jgi:hypothetical protein
MACFRARKQIRWIYYYLAWVVAAAWVLQVSAFAHTSLEAYIRENVFISATTENIDIRIQFNFPAQLSLAERKLMDSDGNGEFSSEERKNYLRQITERADKALRLTLDGQVTVLIPLEDPVLDLQDAPGVEAHPHELRLTYFARIPKTFGIGSTIALDSRLWADTPLLVSVSMEDANGIRFQRVDAQGLRQPSKEDTLYRIMEARCTEWNLGGGTNGRK